MQQVRGVAVLVQYWESERHLDVVASNGCRFHGAVIVPKRLELRSFPFNLQKPNMSILSTMLLSRLGLVDEGACEGGFFAYLLGQGAFEPGLRDHLSHILSSRSCCRV